MPKTKPFLRAGCLVGVLLFACRSGTTTDTLRWDFSSARTTSYVYSQSMKSSNEMMGHDMAMEGHGKGMFDVVSKGDGTANLVLRDLEMTFTKPGARTQKLGPLVVAGVKEDGSSSDTAARGSELLGLLVPLPGRPLAIGETAEVPLSIPFNANGSPLTLRGAAKVTLTGFTEVHGQNCAVLAVVLDLSELAVPAELPGSYEGKVQGTSTLHFNPASRTLVSGKIAIVIAAKFDIPDPDGKTSAMATTMETEITLEPSPAQ